MFSQDQHRDCYRLTGAYFLRLAAMNIGAALLAAAIMAWLGDRMTAADLFKVFQKALTYSFSIGMPAGLVLPYIGEVVRRWNMLQKLGVISAAILAITVAGCLLANVVNAARGLTSAAEFWPEYSHSLRLSSLMALTVGCAAFAFEHLRGQLQEATLELRTRQLEQERAHKLAAEAQLSSLESRIHPHFLFNTLNSIASLIPEDPKRAEEIVGRLAALLRFSLDAHQHGVVPLVHELKIVRDYLEIERARFGARLRYQIQVAPGLDRVEVPPLAVQSLVENSVKHVISQRREGGEIRVSAGLAGNSVVVEVADGGPGFGLEQLRPGHGIDNLISRLSVLYGGSARIEPPAEGNGGVVRLRIPAARLAGAR